MKEINIEELTKNFNGADYYERSASYNIIVGGCGGIGSNTAFLLARSLKSNIIVVDFDKVELHNVGTQFFTANNIGSYKVKALHKQIKMFGIENITPIVSKIEDIPFITPIAVAAFDNIEARKVMFDKWKATKNKKLFIDGRLRASFYQIFSVTPDKIDEYETILNTPFEETGVYCSFKQTSHFAMLLAARITQIITNFITNEVNGIEVSNVPFYTEEFGEIVKINNSCKV